MIGIKMLVKIKNVLVFFSLNHFNINGLFFFNHH